MKGAQLTKRQPIDGETISVKECQMLYLQPDTVHYNQMTQTEWIDQMITEYHQ
ncbi:hypothetical protein HRJ46_16855 [Vibrio coralliilyticus]|uniref:hypothetical protein n=1 Tax=Vibrio coralliilyticus TaxID=190893 RepID=UPI001560D62F|nr:hypothetical protein [Vibrio coralliilyticus]NRG04961.1 hypothetical protein [Vibrio coralliilyticus]